MTYVESPVYTSAPVVSYSPAPVQMMPAYAAPAMTKMAPAVTVGQK